MHAHSNFNLQWCAECSLYINNNNSNKKNNNNNTQLEQIKLKKVRKEKRFAQRQAPKRKRQYEKQRRESVAVGREKNDVVENDECTDAACTCNKTEKKMRKRGTKKAAGALPWILWTGRMKKKKLYVIVKRSRECAECFSARSWCERWLRCSAWGKVVKSGEEEEESEDRGRSTG